MASPIVVTLLLCCILSVSVAASIPFTEAFPRSHIEVLKTIPVSSIVDGPAGEAPPTIAFSCKPVPIPEPVTSISQLKPGHIKVVMAMGDSITAAMSAKDTSVLSLKEYRGLSYSIGGDSGVVTMPNLLKQFTEPNYPVGASTGIGKRTSSTTGLNAAESGDINLDMLAQAQWLVAQLKANTNVNLNEDWKVLSIWIGSNNLCDVCDNYDANSAFDYQKNMVAALDYLQQNVPRLFVNLVANLDITQIYNIKDGMCGILHPIECACAADSSSSVRESTKKVNLEYQQMAYTLAKAYEGDDDFAVVVQPFLTKTVVNQRSYLSPADCFHPSAAAHQYAAIALWNNMISPSSNKTTAWDPAAVPHCPNENTLLYTY